MGKVKKSKANTIQKLPKVSTGRLKAKHNIFKNNKSLARSLSIKNTDNTFLELNANIKDIKKDNILTTTKTKKLQSIKIQKSKNKVIKKKEKILLRRKSLMNKIDAIKDAQAKNKLKQKKKSKSVLEDTDPLRDALPSLTPLLQRKSQINLKLVNQNKKKPGIGKAKQRRRKEISDINLFKRAIKDKTFNSNPFDIISNHIQAVVEKERKSVVEKKEK